MKELNVCEAEKLTKEEAMSLQTSELTIEQMLKPRAKRPPVDGNLQRECKAPRLVHEASKVHIICQLGNLIVL